MTNPSIPYRLPLPLLLLVTCAAIVGGAEAVTSLEARLLEDAVDGTFESFSLWEASLVASGIDRRESLRPYNQRFCQLCRELQSIDEPTDANAARARRVLLFLHSRVLTGDYDAGCTEMARTMDKGDFNCVTATVLYNSLCQHLGLSVATVSEPGHVYSRHPGHAPTDVQNTSPSGFGGQMPASRRIELVGGYSRPYPSGAAVPKREITDVELIAKIYYNRGVSYLEQRQFEPALELLRRANRLDARDEVAALNVLACINNWALDRCDRGQYREASAMLVEGLKGSRDYAPFWENDLHVHHRWISDLVDHGQFAEAMAVLQAGYRRRPDAPLFNEGRAVVYRLWLDALRHSGDRQAWRQVGAAARREFPRSAWPAAE